MVRVKRVEFVAALMGRQTVFEVAVDDGRDVCRMLWILDITRGASAGRPSVPAMSSTATAAVEAVPEARLQRSEHPRSRPTSRL